MVVRLRRQPASTTLTSILAAGSMLAPSDAFVPGGFGGAGRRTFASSKITAPDTAKSSALFMSTKEQPPPSKVVDLDDPTPERPPFQPKVVMTEEIEALGAYDENNCVVPHQPWRRGDVNGCADPIDAQWRLEAEHIIEQAAISVGGYVEDVTWYLTFCVVTLSPNLDSVDVLSAQSGTSDTSNLVTAPDIKVDNTNIKTNVYLDIPIYSADPIGKEWGTFAGEGSGDYEDDDEDDEDDDDYEPQYDEKTGEELPRPRKQRPTRADAIYAYQRERRERAAKRSSRDRVFPLTGRVEPHHLKEGVHLYFDTYTKDIRDFERTLRSKYGYQTRPYVFKRKSRKGKDTSVPITDEDFCNLIDKANDAWGMEPSRLEEYKKYILDQYNFVRMYDGVDRDDNDMNVRADGITQDYADRLSIVGQAILDALGEKEVDARLDILDRHEMILTSANFDPVVVETQLQFDAARGKDVYVHTRDPWDSNRVLKGKLMDRNVMDIIINQSGRMVTIPNNMVEIVKLPDTRVKERKSLKSLVDDLVMKRKAMAEYEEDAENNNADVEDMDVEAEYEEYEEEELDEEFEEFEEDWDEEDETAEDEVGEEDFDEEEDDEDDVVEEELEEDEE